jgi:hypothetical protein
MRIAVLEIYELALDRHQLVLEIGGGKGMMGVSRRARE